MKLDPLLTVFLVVCTIQQLLAAKKQKTDWGKINWEALEREWEEGDDEQELKSEQEIQFEKLEMEKREYENQALDMSTLVGLTKDQARLRTTAFKDRSGPALMFVTISEKFSTKEDIDHIATRIRSIAFSGGLHFSASLIDASAFLINTQKGWEGEAIVTLLLEQPEWNEQVFMANTLSASDGNEDL